MRSATCMAGSTCSPPCTAGLRPRSAQAQPADWRVVHLGDYVDRGPDSKGVLDFLIEVRKRDPRHLMLAGNHDIGFLDFLDAPDADGLFMRYGGIQTAQSYGVALNEGGGAWFGRSEAALRQGHAALVEAVPKSHVEFLQSLPFSLTFGDFFFCHAGIRPGIALESQSAQDLIWIRDVFHNHSGLHPKIVVHGHTPVPEARGDGQPRQYRHARLPDGKPQRARRRRCRKAYPGGVRLRGVKALSEARR